MNTNRNKFLLGVALIGITTLALAQPWRGDSKDHSDWNNRCPMMQGGMGMMGSGMMNRGMMGPSMMGHGMKGMGMMGRGMMHDWSEWRGEGPWSDFNYDRYGELLEPLSKNKAEEIAQFYLDRLNNPRLKVGKILEKDKLFEVEIVTKDKSLVDKILIEKNTGWLYPAGD